MYLTNIDLKKITRGTNWNRQLTLSKVVATRFYIFMYLMLLMVLPRMLQGSSSCKLWLAAPLARNKHEQL